jgi:NAD(P)H dehydrogenase (quinone)
MNALLVYAHPNPQSFNAALAKAIEEEIIANGGQIKVKDLYAIHWDPVLSMKDLQGIYSGTMPEDVKQEQADVAWADLVIMLAPVWWYSIPAILKGYIDRVFSFGFAYKYTATGPLGLLKGKKGLFITTSGANRQDAEMGGMMSTLKKSLTGVFAYSGFQEKKHHNLFAVPTVSDEERREMLAEVRQLIKSMV